MRRARGSLGVERLEPIAAPPCDVLVSKRSPSRDRAHPWYGHRVGGRTRRWRSVRLLAFAWLGAWLWVGRASAYCREVSVGPPSNYDPARLGCFGTAGDGGLFTARETPDGGLLAGSDGRLVPTNPDAGVTLFPLFWRNQCFSYSFQRSGTNQLSASDTARIAAQAFATWSHAACPGGSPNIAADPYPVVDCETPPSQAHNNAIIFHDDSWPYDDGSNAIGYTTLTVSTKTGEIYGADIEINSFGYKIVASLPTSAGDAGAPDPNGTEYDLGSILTHEAGHFLGLAHTADTSAVMYASYSPGATVLTPDDVAGICSIYPSDGTRETGAGRILAGPCNPAPPLGFLTACGSLDSGTLRMGMVGSGGPGVNQGSGDPGSSCPPDCAVGRAPGGGKADLWACGLVALSVLARLGRTLSRGRAGARIALGIGLITGIGVRSSDAAASVSVIATFGQLVQESSAVAVVTPTEQRALWEGDRIATYTHVRVDRRLAGDLEGDVWVRTLGGSVGDVAQIAEGQAIFSLGRPSLVFLRAHVDAHTRQATDSYVVVERAQGQFPVVTSDGKPARLALGGDLGALVSVPPEPRAADARPPPRDPRLARDVLKDRALEGAAREIATAWARAHHPSSR